MKEGAAAAAAPRSQADQSEGRLVDFAVRIVRLSAALPKGTAGRHITGQILRSGTSPAPKYAEREEQKALPISFTKCASSSKS